MKRLLLVVSLLLSAPLFAQTIGFQYSESLIFIPVKLNNVTLTFLLNTGANTSVIDASTAEKLKLPVEKEQDTVTGTAGVQVVDIVRIKTLSIGTSIIRDIVISKRNLAQFIRLKGKKIDGILGTDVLKHYALTIDFQSYKIAFQNAKIPAGRKKTIPFDMSEGIPRLEVRLDDTFNTFLHYNSGVSLAPNKAVYVNISPEQWGKLQSLSKPLGEQKYMIGNGVGGGVYLQTFRINCIELNQRQKIHNGYIIIQPKEGYFKKENSIGFFGNNLLEKYGRVSIDFIARQIVLPVNNPPSPQRKRTTVTAY